MAFTKAQAVIVTVLGMLGGRVHLTKLVKLTYLVDNKFYELNGHTLTGLAYEWDNYGPNAVSNAIVKEVTHLVTLSKAQMVTQQSIYGSDAYLYWTSDESLNEALIHLSPGEVQVLTDTVGEFGHMSVQRIVSAAKATKPFGNAQQYEVLEMIESEPARKLQHKVTADRDFMAAALKGVKDLKQGLLTPQEELDDLYDKQG